VEHPVLGPVTYAVGGAEAPASGISSPTSSTQTELTIDADLVCFESPRDLSLDSPLPPATQAGVSGLPDEEAIFFGPVEYKNRGRAETQAGVLGLADEDVMPRTAPPWKNLMPRRRPPRTESLADTSALTISHDPAAVTFDLAAEITAIQLGCAQMLSRVEVLEALSRPAAQSQGVAKCHHKSREYPLQQKQRSREHRWVRREKTESSNQAFIQ